MSSFVAFTRRVSDGVHIRCCGHGHLWFRPYGGSLLANAPKVTKKSCPSIRCLAKARHALTPALLRGPAATGHPWPGAASAASLPRYPLRNACVRPLGKGRVDQGQDQKPRPKPSAFYAPFVAAAEGCDRARSARQTRRRGVSGRSRRMVLRLLRSRSQPAAAATGISAKSRPTGRSPRVAFGFLAPSGGRVEVLRSGQLGRDAELAAPGHGWPVAAAHGAGPERGNPSPSEDRTLGARAFGYFGLFKVTRRKGETLSGRYRSNGYVHPLRRTNETAKGHYRSNEYVHGQGPEALP
ncbi:outer membrane protein AlgE [Pseudomonas chlororaphis subsp. aurantiaca]|nr:outer membrane protein AlgE [Pseudomonas chlororaphis subsp. aurantiaca]AZD41996.1 outer membrane protein AlgE [Pseudomonas chlororaphis subsp. aurantiaca]